MIIWKLVQINPVDSVHLLTSYDISLAGFLMDPVDFVHRFTSHTISFDFYRIDFVQLFTSYLETYANFIEYNPETYRYITCPFVHSMALTRFIAPISTLPTDYISKSYRMSGCKTYMSLKVPAVLW